MTTSQEIRTYLEKINPEALYIGQEEEHDSALIGIARIKREDEWVAYRVLMGVDEQVKTDVILLVADASNLKRNLLFCSQIIDLKIPVVLALTMNDLAAKKGIKIDVAGLQEDLGIPVVAVDARKSKGLGALKEVIKEIIETYTDEQGVRELRRCIETILLKLNMRRFTEEVRFPLQINSDIIKEYLKKQNTDDFLSKMLYL